MGDGEGSPKSVGLNVGTPKNDNIQPYFYEAILSILSTRSKECRCNTKTDYTGYLITWMLEIGKVFPQNNKYNSSDFSVCLQYKEGTECQFLQQNVGIVNTVYLRLQASFAT